MKLFDNFRIISVILLIIIPILYLHNYFAIQADNTGFLAEELVKEKLLNEMDSFLDNLKPERHIELAFQDLENQFKIPDLNNNQYKYMYDGTNEPDFFSDNFIKKAKYFLRENYGFEPFVFVSSSYDFNDIDFEDKDKVFKKENEKNKFLFSCLGGILSYELTAELDKLKALSDKSKTTFEKNIFRIINECGNQYYPKFEKVMIGQMVKNISIFFKDIGKPNTCFSFFSNYFENQRIYQYYNCLLNSVNKECYNFFGLYYVLVKSSDISIEKMLYKASNNLYNNKFSEIKRGISDSRIKAPKWTINEKHIKYEVPFPSHFYNFISDHKNLNNEVFVRYQDYLKEHSLVVGIDRQNIENDYLIYKKSLEKILWILGFVIVFYFIYSFLKKNKFKLSLANKVRLIVFVAVSVPMIGLWIISYLGIKKEESIVVAKTEKCISERMAILDKVKDETICSFIYDLLDYKKFFADTYFKNTPENFFLNSNLKILSDSMNKNSFFSNTFLLDKYGRNAAFSNGYLRDSNNFKDIFHLYRFLNEMGLLDSNTPENKKHFEQNLLLSTYTDAYFKNKNLYNDIAKEDLLIPAEALSLKDRVCYQLIASASKPDEPFALAYSNIYMRDLMDYRVNHILNAFYPELLSQETSFAQIKYAIFTRRESDYREKIPQTRAYPFRLMHLDSVKKAIAKKNSGTEITEHNNYYYIKTWHYYNDAPVIFVAAALVSKSHVNLITGNMLGLILLIYTVLIVSLLSDVFSEALLEPIRTLYKFVNEISLGHLNVKINMKTGDEMQDLGESFNRMSDGLCEREKLKRFVSDKLYSSIEKSDEKRINKVKVTILSSDIRSFTTISEKNEPEKVVSLLNDYFTLMEKSIVKYGGSIEKIVGDAISAAFYEDKNSEYALQACKAALEMRESLKQFNQDRIEKGLFTIENGIGLATGEVMIGFAGEKARRREFLLIGNIIKSAETLESMTKQAVSSKVFIDKQTYEFVHDKIKLCPEMHDTDIFYRELLS